MVIDVRGNTDEETYRNAIIAATACGLKSIRVVCEDCGSDAYVFKNYQEDEQGYYKRPCDRCGGKMKRDTENSVIDIK